MAILLVGCIFFATLVLAAFFLFGYTVRLQAEQGFTLAFLIILSAVLPFALRQTLLQQNTSTQAVVDVTIANIVVGAENGKRVVNFTTSAPAMVYLQYELDGQVLLVLPPYTPSRRTDHKFYLDTLPPGVSSLSIMVNGKENEEKITLP